MKRENAIWLVVWVCLFIIGFGVGSYFGDTKLGNDLEELNKVHQHKIYSLSTLIVAQHELNTVLEEDYYKRLDSIETKNKKEIEKLRKQYQSKLTAVRELPIDSQIEFFEDYLQVDVGYMKKVVEKQDTSIQISSGQLVEINQKFVELDYMYDLKDTLDSQLDSCYSLLDYSKVVTKEKSQEIDLLNQVNKEKGNYISDLNKTLLEQRKTAKKRMIRNSIISGTVGIIVGVLVNR